MTLFEDRLFLPLRPPAYTMAFLNLQRPKSANLPKISRPKSVPVDFNHPVSPEPLVNLSYTSSAESLLGQSWNWDVIKDRIERRLDGDEDVPSDEDDQCLTKSFSVSTKTYVKTCKTIGICPSVLIRNHLDGGKLRVINQVLTPKDVKALCITLQGNTNIQVLELKDNNIGTEGTYHISSMIQDNIYITNLTLANNKILAKSISESLIFNDTVESLNLSGNAFKDHDAIYLAELIEKNTSITELNLSHNQFREQGGKYLADAIAKNRTLTSLDLSWNHLRRQGAVAICNSLKVNVYLEVLNVSWNGFSIEGCKTLVRSLRINKTLTELDLSCNRIDKTCLMELIKGLKDNRWLKTLKLGDNPISVNGANILMRLIFTTNPTTINHLDIRGQCVDQEFVKMCEAIKLRNPSFVVKHGRVLNEQKRSVNKQDDFVKDDPMIVLMEFMRLKNLRLVDLFKKLDTDGSKTLTYKEFRDGLMSVNIPLNRHSINQLIKRMDKDGDGEVDFAELIKGQRDHRKRISKLQLLQKDKPYEETVVGKVTVKLKYLLSQQEREKEKKCEEEINSLLTEDLSGKINKEKRKWASIRSLASNSAGSVF